MPQHLVTCGLGFGDESKGTVVEALVRKHEIGLVIRYSGGPQCAHNVVLPNGTHHTFAQFGSGTLSGADTLLTRGVLVDPVRLLNEATALEGKGISHPTNNIMVEDEALVITPFHREVNWYREYAREKTEGRHGSCGVGVGETAAYALKYPDRALRVRDLRSPRRLETKLRQIEEDLHQEWYRLLTEGCDWASDTKSSVFHSRDLIDALLWRYHVFESSVACIRHDQVLEMVSRQDAVWEGAQGILLDEDYGFHPYTTWSKVTMANALALLDEAGVKERTRIGVTRTYTTRHGPGPLPTQTMVLDRITPEHHNAAHEWQGAWRRGYLDLSLLAYAVEVNGGLDGVAITHADVLGHRETWPVCWGYRGWSITKLPPTDLARREAQARDLMRIEPHPSLALRMESVRGDRVGGLISEVAEAPIYLTSSGPTFEHKTFTSPLIPA